MRPPQQQRRAAALAARAAACVLAAAAAAGSAEAAEPPWAAMPATLLPLRLPVASGADPAGWQLRSTAAEFSAADATPVRALDGDWARYHPRDGRNAALQQARLELSAARQGWELAATLRSELALQGSRGAFDVVHAYKQRQTPADGSRFAVDAQAQGVVWAGLRAAQTWTIDTSAEPGVDHRSATAAGAAPALQLSAALTLLSVRQVRRDAAQGSLHYTSLAGYAFDASTLQQDSRRQFGGYGRQDAGGSGFSADLGLLWQPRSGPLAGGFVNLSAVDLVSRLQVRGLSTETSTLSSATRSIDADGYLDYRPLVQGRDSARDQRLQLARKWSVSAGLPVPALGDGALIGARWERTAGISLPALWAVLPCAAVPGLALQLDAETRFRSLGLGLRAGPATLLLRSRPSRVGASSALGWQAGLAWPW